MDFLLGSIIILVQADSALLTQSVERMEHKQHILYITNNDKAGMMCKGKTFLNNVSYIVKIWLISCCGIG